MKKFDLKMLMPIILTMIAVVGGLVIYNKFLKKIVEKEEV